MRKFKDGDDIWIEPWRAKAFPVIRDLVVDRSAFDKIIQAGGYISTTTGGVPDANTIPISKHAADMAMDAASCIGCGACVAACKNASAMLFVGAKVCHLALLPQGQVEGRAGLRQLHQHLRLRGRMSEAHQKAEYLHAQQAVDQRFIRERQKVTPPQLPQLSLSKLR